MYEVAPDTVPASCSIRRLSTCEPVCLKCERRFAGNQYVWQDDRTGRPLAHVKCDAPSKPLGRARPRLSTRGRRDVAAFRVTLAELFPVTVATARILLECSQRLDPTHERWEWFAADLKPRTDPSAVYRHGEDLLACVGAAYNEHASSLSAMPSSAQIWQETLDRIRGQG